MITGAGGMVGSHMVDYFYNANVDKVVGTYYRPTTDIMDIQGKAELLECDIRYFTNVYDIVKKYLPTQIYHLAAQSYPAISWDKPQETMEINITGTINLFEAIRRIKKENQDYVPTVVVACSSAEYGNSLLNCNKPVDENVALLPLHPYGISKVGQDLLSYQYYINFGIHTVRARIFNTTGPRKVNDVCADFTKRIVLMENTSNNVTNKLRVGNLETFRAITDVRDLVNALILLAEKGKAGEVYNISGKSIYKIRDIIDIIRRHTDIQFDIEIDKALLRLTDEKVICGNSDKLYKETSWKQKYDLETTIVDMLDYWRKKL